jgi:lipoate-protein ligase A
MTRVRELSLEIEPSTYPAVERTLIDAIAEGEAPPTVMNWTFDDDLFLSLGPVEDASLIDRDAAADAGVNYSRRYNVSGGTGFFEGDNTPVLYMFFPDRGERQMTEYIDLAGEAMAQSLRDAGVTDAIYRDGGDVELEPDEPGGQYGKIGVSGAGYQDGVWGVFTNLINWTFEPEVFATIDEVLQLPDEKFEDKETDSAAGRMTSLQDVAPDVDLEPIVAETVENLADIIDGTAEARSLTDAEREAIEEHREYFASDEWFERYSTTRVFETAGPDDRVAEVAFKGRKLIKASVVVGPDDRLEPVQFTGDMYHKPAFEAVERLSEAVRELPIDDDEALRTAAESVYETADFEMPWLPVDDFLAPLDRARDSLQPADEFERA